MWVREEPVHLRKEEGEGQQQERATADSLLRSE